MDRRSFIKGLIHGVFIALATTTIPIVATQSKNEFCVHSLFDKDHGDSGHLILKSGCWLDNALKDELGKRVVDRVHFKFNYPLQNMYLPIKEHYTKDDFASLLAWARAQRDFGMYFCNGSFGAGLCELHEDPKKGVYAINFFAANNPNIR